MNYFAKAVLLFTLLNTVVAATLEQRVTYEQFKLPDGHQTLGAVGLHELIDFNSLFYGGMGVYGGVRGESGGYFALALEGGVQHPIYDRLWFDAGARIGGGGGSHTAVGGGLFIQPYTGLKYDFGFFRTGLNYNYIRFTDGRIASSQWGIDLSFPVEFKTLTASSTSQQNYFALLAKSYLPRTGTLDTRGQINDHHFEFLGIEFAHFFTESVFGFANFAGALHGRSNGYADALVGAGYRWPLFKRLNLIGRLSMGSGGGGAVNTGGGFIYQPALGLEYLLTPRLGLELNGAYTAAPKGDLKAKVMNVLFKYYLNNGMQAEPSTWRIRISNQTYLQPRSQTGSINPTMQLLGLDIDYYLRDYLYLTGKTAFAYRGRNTGGYFSGELGLGAETPKLANTPVSIFAEVLGGTAGGAGLDIGEGALIEPRVGVHYYFNNAFSLQASAGRLIALKGQFSSTVLNLGLSYKFSTF